jgi:hypothetical protein
MKTAISVPGQVFEAADRLARSLGVSRSQLYSTALARFLQEHDVAEITAKLDHLYASQPSALDEHVQELQASSLPEGDW